MLRQGSPSVSSTTPVHACFCCWCHSFEVFLDGYAGLTVLQTLISDVQHALKARVHCS